MWHYDHFSQIVLLEKAIRKRSVLCFTSAFMFNGWKQCKLVGMLFLSKTGASNIIFFRWHKFTIKTLFYNKIFLYSSQNETHRIHCCVATAKWLCERPTVLRYTYIAYLVICYNFPHPCSFPFVMLIPGEIPCAALSCSHYKQEHQILWVTLHGLRVFIEDKFVKQIHQLQIDA
jgi:hypothetical protein